MVNYYTIVLNLNISLTKILNMTCFSLIRNVVVKIPYFDHSPYKTFCIHHKLRLNSRLCGKIYLRILSIEKNGYNVHSKLHMYIILNIQDIGYNRYLHLQMPLLIQNRLALKRKNNDLHGTRLQQFTQNICNALTQLS